MILCYNTIDKLYFCGIMNVKLLGRIKPNTTPYGDIAGMSRKIFTGKSPIRQYYCV